MKSSGSNSSSNGGDRSSCKMERKAIEKQRRIHMKGLCLKLSSLIPKQHFSKDALTQPDSLDEAASYIIKLRNKIEKLKERREEEREMQGISSDDVSILRLPIIEVRYRDPNLEVVLITSGMYHKFTFHKVIRIIEEEGADIVNASLSTTAQKVIYTIHSQSRSPRIGLEPSRLSNRLKEWI